MNPSRGDQPYKERPADNCRDKSDRHLKPTSYESANHVGRYQERRTHEYARHERMSVVAPYNHPGKLASRQPDKCNNAGGPNCSPGDEPSRGQRQRHDNANIHADVLRRQGSEAEHVQVMSHRVHH